MKLSCQEGLVPGASFAEKLRSLEQYGFDGVELNGSRLEGSDLQERKAALGDSPIRASSICGGAPAELVHPDCARRQRSIDAYRRMLDLAAELGAAGPIAVPIFNNNDRCPDLSPYRSRSQLEKELLLCVLEDLGPYGAERGVAILLEPLNRYESNSLSRVEDAAEYCRTIGRGVKVMADFFHMHIEERSTPASLETLGGVLGHVHLADNTRLEPGTGDIDFRAGFASLRKIGYQGYMAFECGLSGSAAEALPRSVRYLRDCIG